MFKAISWFLWKLMKIIYLWFVLIARLSNNETLIKWYHKARTSLFCFIFCSNSLGVPENFQTKFRKNPPHGNCISCWLRKFVTTGCLCAKKRSGRPYTTQCGVLRQSLVALIALITKLHLIFFLWGLSKKEFLLPSYTSKPVRLKAAHNRSSAIYITENVTECKWVELEYRLHNFTVTNHSYWTFIVQIKICIM